MNKYRYLIVSLSILFLTGSCGEERLSNNKNIETALSMSGGNRPELERVLNHYSKEPKDSLKLKAAEFLIGNMLYHRSMSGECIVDYTKMVDSLYKNIELPVRSVYYMIPSRLDSLKSHIVMEADIKKITADFLIKNIEYSFNVWENSIFEPRITFDDFCEYVLPYKHSEEPLIMWKDSSDSENGKNRDINNYELNMIMANLDVSYMTKSQYFTTYMKLFTDKDIYAAGAKYLAYMKLALMRSKGIPTAIDFIPFTNITKDSYWTVMINRKYLDNNYTDMNKNFTSKVFRKTYSLNLTPDDKINFVPPFIQDHYNKDVTAIYQNTTTIEYDFGNIPSSVKYAYLAVFHTGKWCEVSWAELNKGKASFKDMGHDVVYMPIYYNGENRICAKNAILLNRSGNISKIGSINHKKQSVVLNRISTYDIAGEFQAKSLIGVKIAACNSIEKIIYDTLSTITHSKYNDFDTINVNSEKKYRCWLLLSSDYSYFSEVQFIDKNGAPIKGRAVWFGRENKMSSESFIKSELFDNNILTSRDVNGAMGILLEKPTAISYVKYMPENDQCGIIPGNEYELFYLRDGEWVSLAKKVATSYEIEFKNVPVDALLWVHDHGKECYERPFTLVNGKIKFW